MQLRRVEIVRGEQDAAVEPGRDQVLPRSGGVDVTDTVDGSNLDTDADALIVAATDEKRRVAFDDNTVNPQTQLAVYQGEALSDDFRHTQDAIVKRSTADEQLVDMWLHGRSRHTKRSYRTDVDLFLAFVGKTLHQIQLADVQAFSDHLNTLDLVDGSRHKMLSSIKSLFAFAARLGYLPFNVAQPLRLPAGKDTLNERILEVGEVTKMITAETNPRNKFILQLLYVAGVRVSELVGLTWSNVQAHRGEGQITVFDKGGKTRSIRLEGAIWKILELRRGTSPATAPVIASPRGGHFSTSQIRRIVLAAANRVQLNKPVSSHWLRHCHASHALDGGAPINLVQQTLGHTNVATTSKYLHVRPNQSSSKFLPPIT